MWIHHQALGSQSSHGASQGAPLAFMPLPHTLGAWSHGMQARNTLLILLAPTPWRAGCQRAGLHWTATAAGCAAGWGERSKAAPVRGLVRRHAACPAAPLFAALKRCTVLCAQPPPQARGTFWKAGPSHWRPQVCVGASRDWALRTQCRNLLTWVGRRRQLKRWRKIRAQSHCCVLAVRGTRRASAGRGSRVAKSARALDWGAHWVGASVRWAARAWTGCRCVHYNNQPALARYRQTFLPMVGGVGVIQLEISCPVSGLHILGYQSGICGHSSPNDSLDKPVIVGVNSQRLRHWLPCFVVGKPKLFPDEAP
jgi:hypothetical protein